MSDKQQIAVLVLWQTGRLDTSEIANLTGVSEAKIYNLIHADREAKRASA